VIERTSSPRDTDRRGKILAAALACFLEQGVEATTIQDICERSGASVGSVYHHFGSKQGVVRDLVAGGLLDNLATVEDRLRRTRSAKAGVEAIVAGLFSWVELNPDWARFIYQRTAVPDGDVVPVMAEVTRQWAALMERHGSHAGKGGQFRSLPGVYVPSLLLGPTHDFARRWLAGQVPGPLSDHVRVFQRAAWDLVGKPARA
jgi:AcrR family transcriptional regulator